MPMDGIANLDYVAYKYSHSERTVIGMIISALHIYTLL